MIISLTAFPILIFPFFTFEEDGSSSDSESSF